MIVRGSGGKGGGGGRTAQEASDTLRSKQYARLIDVVSEGEIGGLVNGLKSVYLDDVPIQNADNTFNFTDVSIINREGTQNQTHVAGFPDTEVEAGVGVEVVKATPLVRSITNVNANAVRVTLSVPTLTEQSTTTGDLSGSSVEVAIDVQNNGGGYVPQIISTYTKDLVWNGSVLYSEDPITGADISVNWVGTATTDELQWVTWRVDYRAVGDVTWIALESGSFSGTAALDRPEWLGGILRGPTSSSSVSLAPSITDEYEFRVVFLSGFGTLSLSGTGLPYSATDIISGKTTSKYQWSYRIALPEPGPWDIRVRRLSDDSTSAAIQNKTFWDSYTTIIDTKLSYPNTAYFACAIDAAQFSSIPSRGYEIKGIKIKIPSNYNPTTRVYTGVWDGTFVTAWSDNPAWCFYDLITNARYGLGDFISEAQLDKWELYTIGKYCDELIPTGLGGTEPRFTCNIFIQTREEAYKVIQSMASIFRGLTYWAGGVITAFQDSPKDPTYLFNKSNVIDGNFSYSGTSGKQRHTVALVTWNDPAERYKQKIEYVEDPDGIALHGVIQTEVVAIGCTSRGQAHRVGKWLLFTERMETETIVFRTGLEGLSVVPGDVIQTTDTMRSGERVGGRIISATTDTVVLDAPVTLAALSTYTLWIVLEDGTIESREVITPASTTDTLTVASVFTSVPLDYSMWVLSTDALLPETWRVFSVTEVEGTQAEISAIEYRADKYDAVELDVILQPLQTTSILLIPDAPSNVTATEHLYLITQTLVGTKITVSWTSTSPLHTVTWKREGDNLSSYTTTESSYDISSVLPGTYTITVRAKNSIGVSSETVTKTLIVYGLTAPPQDVSNFNITSLGSQANLTWDASTDLDVIIGGYLRIRYTPELISPSWSNSVDIGKKISGNSTQTTLPAVAGAYLAKWVDSSGNQSSNATIIITDAANIQSLNFVEELLESPDFTGDKTNLALISSGLTLDSAETIGGYTGLISELPKLSLMGGIASTGTYLFSEAVDLSQVHVVRVTAALFVSGYDAYDLISLRGLVSTWPSVSGTVNDATEAVLYIRTTEDDPLVTPVWTSWTPFLVGDYSARAFEFKLVLSTNSTTQNIATSYLSVTVDMPDRIEDANDVVSGTSTYSVTYNLPFLTNPSLGISAQGFTTGDYYEITNKTNTGFDILFKDSSATPVSKTFDYIAKGY